MRNIVTSIAVVLFLLTFPALAQELGPRVTFFASGVEYQSAGAADSQLNGGVGLALGSRWSPRWSGELSVTTQRHRGAPIGVLAGSGLLIRELVRSEPVDALIEYHVGSSVRWKPYVTAGAHYLDAEGASSSISPQVGAGVFFGIKERLWLKVEARQILGNRTPYHDPAFKPSLGVAFTF